MLGSMLKWRYVYPVAGKQEAMRGEYTGFPVDKGTVAVKAQNRNVSEIQHLWGSGLWVCNTVEIDAPSLVSAPGETQF